MAELTLLLPALARIQALGMPATLNRWVVRGDRLADARPGRETALRECFEFTGAATPSAALTRSMDSSDAASALWVRADPCYAVADAVTVRMLASAIADLSLDESDQLARALQPLFGDAGFPLEPATANRWYLRCPIGSRLPQFAAPEDVLGDDMLRHLPQGENERQWRHLLNEAQVILHNHPLNVERTARGQVPVTSLWFWGAGRLPDWVRTNHTQAFSADDVLAALARAAKLGPVSPSLPAEVLLSPKGGSDERLLFDFADSRDMAMLEREVFSVLDAGLRQRRVRSVRLLFERGERVAVKRAHRWRFWRRVKPASTQ